MIKSKNVIIYTSIKTKLKEEVGMAGSKSTQTRFVRHKHLLYIPSLAFLDDYAPSYKCDVFVMWHVGDIQAVPVLFFIALSIIYQFHLKWLAHSTLSIIK